MHVDLFYRLGKGIHRYRWFVISLFLLMIISCLPFTPKITNPFKDIGFVDQSSESERANKTLNKKFGYSYNQFIVMYHSDELKATDPEFIRQIKKSLADFKNFHIKNQVIYPDKNNKQISDDKHTAYAVILFEGDQESSQQLLKDFKLTLNEPVDLEMRIGGEPVFLDDTRTQTQTDLFKSEYIATPVAIITMLVVFGTVVAASIPIVLGAICAFLILMTLFILGHFFSLSVFTLNIALLLGICLSLDYALLIVSRFRDELSHRATVAEAVAVTQSTAGKSVFFSGLAVFISLSALLLFKIDVLFSVGMGGLAAVSVAVLNAIVLLPAVLSILNKKIDRFPVPFFKPSVRKDNPYCRWIVTKVVKRPLIYFITILVFLLALGFPFLHVQIGISDFRILPEDLESRQVFDIFASEFGESRLSPVLAIVKSNNKNILTENNINALYNFVNDIKKDKRIEDVNSIVSTVPRLTNTQYQMLYTMPKSQQSPDIQKLLKMTTNHNLTVVTIVSKKTSYSPETAEFIKELRQKKLKNHLKLEVTGASANTTDVLQSISKTFPYAFLWIIVFTYLILLVFLRSVILPLKAILTTILSLFASYGVLVLVIQEGYLHTLLHFEPQGMLDISLLIIIFCALFGISMDYEVFLLTRIKECYEQSHDSIKSIVFGIDRSWKIITSAAIIVILICFSFMSADILIVKAFGLGIAVAVFVDAYIIRTLLVPATMTLLGDWNWYLPKWLDKILPRISFDPEFVD
ncbi:MAG TPA: MMPL family transporter [Gammaproteobacteria bacterium]|jgi:RND superfamily putative drug exporter|nr:MMPL family transporter [Gammaproteobacteria bacterium]